MNSGWNGPVVVGLDGSHTCDVLVEVGAGQARQAGSPCCWSSVGSHRRIRATPRAPPHPDDIAANFQRTLDEVLSTRTAVASAWGRPPRMGVGLTRLAVRSEICEGHPERILREAALGASKLVVGNRGP